MTRQNAYVGAVWNLEYVAYSSTTTFDKDIKKNILKKERKSDTVTKVGHALNIVSRFR